MRFKTGKRELVTIVKFTQAMGLIIAASLLGGCVATQPIKWTTYRPLDLTKGGKVTVTASCQMPPADIAYLQGDIQQKVRDALSGNPDLPDAYKVQVTITKYDEGNAFARFMLIGLGQMYLYGTVEIKQGEPPVIVRQGDFKKNYSVGGIAGGMATMQKDILPTVGQAVVDAIRKQQAE